MVMNIGEFKGQNYDAVENDIKAVVKVGHDNNKIVKVIIENALLTPKPLKLLKSLPMPRQTLLRHQPDSRLVEQKLKTLKS